MCAASAIAPPPTKWSRSAAISRHRCCRAPSAGTPSIAFSRTGTRPSCSDTAQKHIIKGETYGRSFELYREPGTQDAGDRIEGGRNDRQRDRPRDDPESAEQRRQRRYRKSGESGTSGSVRVDPGGIRSITKKKTK